MAGVFHLDAGARERCRLVQDDHDRRRVARATAAALGDACLAWCIMDTHVHVAVFGDERALAASLTRALSGVPLRGPVVTTGPKEGFEIARAIKYVHDNPGRTDVPLVTDAVIYPWSSAREFAGLAWPAQANLALARRLTGKARWALPPPWPLAGLEPSAEPCAEPRLLIAAVAQALRLPPATLVARGGTRVVTAARAAFVHLGRLEGCSNRQLAAALRRTRMRVNQLALAPADAWAIRAARTLARDPAFRTWLGASSLEESRGARTTRGFLGGKIAVGAPPQPKSSSST